MRVSVTRFLLFSAIFVGSGMLVTDLGGFESLQAITAAASGAVAGILGAPTTVLGSNIVTAAGTIDVVNACLPIGMTAVFSALVVSTETTNSRRLAGLAGVFAVVFVANVIRVTVAIMAAQVGSAFFGYAHGGPLQMLPEALLFVPWLVWSGAEHRKAALAFAGYTALLAIALSLIWPIASAEYLQLRLAILGDSSTMTVGLQPIGASPWLVTGIAVLVAAKGHLRRRALAVALLIAGVIVADFALTVGSSSLGIDQTLLRGSLTLMAPLLAVVFFVRGRLSTLWSEEAPAPLAV